MMMMMVMKRSGSASIATIALTLACSAIAAEGDGPQAAPQASRQSLPDVFKGLRDKVQGKKKGAEASAPSGADSDKEAGSTAATATEKAGAMKLKEFQPGSKLPANWNDTHCRNLVEPFGLSDSAMSLGKLKAETTVRGKLGEIVGTPVARGDSRGEIRKAARQLNWLPMPVERSIGQKMHDDQVSLMRDGKSGKELYARARKILADVTSQIKEDHPYRFEIFVTTESGGNAEAAPGGFIYVDKDLVGSAEAEPKARFAIAHEVSHVLQRHRTRETQMRLSDGVDSLEDLGKLMASARGGPDAFLKKGVDTKRMFVKHSEEQELQADGCAVRLLEAMIRDRAELIKSINAFVESLPKPQPAEPQKKVTIEAVFTELSDGQFSRHPSTQARATNLKAVLADLRAGT